MVTFRTNAQLLGCLIAALVALASPVQAQDVGEDAGAADAHRTEARTLFERGRNALNNRRFTEAITDFRASLQRHTSLGTAFNLANALRGAARTAEAVDVFDALLAGEYGELSEEQRREAQHLRDETYLELAVIRVRVVPDQAVIRIDGNMMSGGGEAREYRLTGGRHVVDARAEGYEAEEQVLVVDGGAARDIAFDLEALADQGTGTPRRSRAWIWVVLGVAVAGGAALAIGLSVRNRNTAFVDDEFGSTMTLRFGP